MPNPSDYKTEDDFVSACIGERQDENPDESQEQSAAICYSMWRDKAAPKIVHKTHATDVQGMEFVLSDETVDRYQDVIAADGWSLDNFRKNPIALFNHDANFPVGKWKNLRVVNGALRGHLEMAPEGISARIDEIRKLIDAGILKAVSVGFHPIESAPRKSAPGTYYAKSELVETSLVSIPANPNALAIARALKISDDTQKMVFGEHADKKIVNRLVRRASGKHADTPRKSGGRTMSSPISTRIADTEKRIVGLKDQLTQHLSNVDDANPTDESTTITEDLTQKIENQERSLEVLKKAESHIAASAVVQKVTHFDDGSSSKLEVRAGRPFSVPAKQVKPVDLFWRSMTVAAKHYGQRGRRPMLDILKEEYGEDDKTRAVMEYVTRTDAAPAITTVSGWASQLVQTVVADLVEALTPVSVYPKVAAMGTTYAFSRGGGLITLPSRTSGNLGGGFVAEGKGIPVKQGLFTSVTLNPKKMAVITTFTREMSEYSSTAIETILRQAIVEDTAVAIDTAFFADTDYSTTAPQGLKGIANAGLTAATGSAAVDMIADLKAMVKDLISATSGNLRRPVWIINPGAAITMMLTQAAAGGDLPFRDELSRNTLLGIPVIQSTGCGDAMYLLDAADFATAQGAPRFDVSDQAVLVMADSGVDDLVAASGAPVPAEPARSLYQTDSMAVRMIWPMDWCFRRDNVCAYIANPNWD